MKSLFVAVLLFSATSVSFAASFVVNDIRLEGLQRVSASPVFAAMPLRVGQTADAQAVRDVIRSLYGTGFFSDIEVAREDGTLIITLRERPAIKSLEIDGNKAIKTEQLTAILDDNGLSEGEILQRHRLQGITRELERQYVGQARYGATVDVEVDELPNSLVAIKILVDEGGAAKIRHINFVGNELYDDDELLDFFELGESRWYGLFSNADKYAKERLSGDLETLESFYLDRGYLDFEVISSQVSVSPDKKGVFITLNMQEGKKYQVSSVELAGDPILDEKVIERLFLLGEGDTFSQARMTSTSEYITTLLGNYGYTSASVEGVPQKNKEDGSVNVTFFIDPGKRVYVRRMEFSGNRKTSDEVLRREMRQIEGASASNARIESSKVKLERLGYFKQVNVETVEVPGHSDLVDVKFDVEEQPSGSVQASVGYSEAYDVTLGASVTENNWLGTGKKVQFSINHNRFQDNYTFQYNDPYFTPDGVSRGFSVYYRNSDFTSANFGSSYASDSAGATVTFGYPISEIAFLRFGLGVANQNLKVGDTVGSNIRQSPFFFDDARANINGEGHTYDVGFSYMNQADFNATHFASMTPYDFEFNNQTFAITEDVIPDREPGFIDKYGNDYNSGAITASWIRNTLNRGILPTRGNSQSLSLETTVPGSDLEFYKIQLEAKQFIPLFSDYTLRLRSRVGYGDGYGKMDELPFFENFRTGGIGSVRGFEPFTLGPLDTPSELYVLGFASANDFDNNGELGVNEYQTPTYVLCEDPTTSSTFGCEPGKLAYSTFGSSRLRSSGGNTLVELSAELLLPIPFAADTRSMQLVAFYDAGNVFSTSCRQGQLRCTDLDLSRLRTSWGFGFKWLSGFGPMSFSFAWPNKESSLDETKRFQFSFGAGF
ncbi:MAG: outer membrane protein assembly factor BamA [Agarilytica sp.]